jgi:hypothetical protein
VNGRLAVTRVLLFLIPARARFEHQVGVPVRVRQAPDLINHEQGWTSVMPQPVARCGVAVEGGKIAEQVAGTGEQYGMSLDQRPAGDVLRLCGVRNYAESFWMGTN